MSTYGQCKLQLEDIQSNGDSQNCCSKHVQTISIAKSLRGRGVVMWLRWYLPLFMCISVCQCEYVLSVWRCPARPEDISQCCVLCAPQAHLELLLLLQSLAKG